MMKAAVVLDAWKLPIFKRRLDEAGFVYEQFTGPLENCITLKVQTRTIARLQPIIQAANDEAARQGRSTEGGEG